MKNDRSSPRQLTHLQVLGEFLERFECGAVVLLCVLKGVVYPFARWRTDAECGELNLAWILGQCREVDALGYAAHWSALEPCPSPPLLEGPAQPSAPLNDEEILRRFMREVECDAAI